MGKIDLLVLHNEAYMRAQLLRLARSRPGPFSLFIGCCIIKCHVDQYRGRKETDGLRERWTNTSADAGTV